MDSMKNVLKRQFVMFSKAGLAELRVFFAIETNELWFAVSDVAAALSGSADANQSLPTFNKLKKAHPDVAIKATIEARDGKQRRQWLMNESALYTVVLSSKSPKADPFRQWVTGEVLPSIRKEGAYIFGQENLDAESRDALLAETRALLTKAEERAAKAEKNAAFYKDDADYCFKEWQRAQDALLKAETELYALKPKKEKVSKKEVVKKVIAENREIQEELSYNDREGWMFSVEPGKKYEIRDREER